MVLTGTQIGNVITGVLSAGASARLRVRGGSMFPSLRNDDVLIIEPVVASELRRGSVILACSGDRLIAHRVRNVRFDAKVTLITTRGDNRREDDHPLTAQSVVGRVVAVERHGRRVDVPKYSFALSFLVRLRLLSVKGGAKLVAWARRSGAGELSLQS